MSTARNTPTAVNTYSVQRRRGDVWETLDVYDDEDQAEATLARYTETYPESDFTIAVDLAGTDANVDPDSELLPLEVLIETAPIGDNLRGHTPPLAAWVSGTPRVNSWGGGSAVTYFYAEVTGADLMGQVQAWKVNPDDEHANEHGVVIRHSAHRNADTETRHRYADPSTTGEFDDPVAAVKELTEILFDRYVREFGQLIHDGAHEWSRPEESAVTRELIEVCMISSCDASRRAESDRIVHHSTTGDEIEVDVFVTGRGWTVYSLNSTQARQLGEGLIASADMLEAQFTLTIDGESAWTGDRAEMIRQILELLADSEVPVDAHYLELSQRRSVLDAITSFMSGKVDELLVDFGGRGTDKARQRVGISPSIGGRS